MNIACFDFASLYPSIMRQFNISADSFVEKLDINDEDKKIKRRQDKSVIVTNTGAVFKNEEDSILHFRDICSFMGYCPPDSYCWSSSGFW